MDKIATNLLSEETSTSDGSFSVVIGDRGLVEKVIYLFLLTLEKSDLEMVDDWSRQVSLQVYNYFSGVTA